MIMPDLNFSLKFHPSANFSPHSGLFFINSCKIYTAFCSMFVRKSSSEVMPESYTLILLEKHVSWIFKWNWKLLSGKLPAFFHSNIFIARQISFSSRLTSNVEGIRVDFTPYLCGYSYKRFNLSVKIDEHKTERRRAIVLSGNSIEW